ALWICMDAATLTTAAERLRRQQEVEQLIEDYLAVEPGRTMERPVALVLTKADLVQASAVDKQEWAGAFEMIRHAMRTHCPRSDLFAVSCLHRSDPDAKPALEPRNLDGPLTWLATALQAQDEERLRRLFALATSLPLLARGMACTARRYPDSAVVN